MCCFRTKKKKHNFWGPTKISKSFNYLHQLPITIPNYWRGHIIYNTKRLDGINRSLYIHWYTVLFLRIFSINILTVPTETKIACIFMIPFAYNDALTLFPFFMANRLHKWNANPDIQLVYMQVWNSVLW